MSNFLASAESRETSPELMAAILSVAGNSELMAERIWDAPTEAEQLAIWETVTKNGLHDASDFCWGASGSNWAEQFSAPAISPFTGEPT